jgi:type IV pilus assembly protein PilB
LPCRPAQPGPIDELGFVVKKDIQLVVADPARSRKPSKSFTASRFGRRKRFRILKELGADADIARRRVRRRRLQADLMEDLANKAPIVRFVNLVLFQAVQDRASDIHFEPFEDEVRIRYRVDGALYEMSPPPKHLALPVISRIKVMANLNISERRCRRTDAST